MRFVPALFFLDISVIMAAVVYMVFIIGNQVVAVLLGLTDLFPVYIGIAILIDELKETKN